MNDEDTDVTRRTHLAAERTWLAWWRTGIATTATGVGVGGVVPHLVGGTRWPYVALGAGYAALSIALFLMAGRRQHAVSEALEQGGYADLSPGAVMAFTTLGSLLALGTLVAVVVSL